MRCEPSWRKRPGAVVAVCDPRGEVIALLSTNTSPLPRSTRPSQQPGKETQEIGEASRSEDFAIANIGDLRCTGWEAESGSSLLAAPLAQQVLWADDMEPARMGARPISSLAPTPYLIRPRSG